MEAPQGKGSAQGRRALKVEWRGEGQCWAEAWTFRVHGLDLGAFA